MSKPEYQDLVDVLTKVYKTSRIENVLNVEWANYPVEVFEEIGELVLDLQIEEQIDKKRLPDIRGHE
jgi:hypothetical protein